MVRKVYQSQYGREHDKTLLKINFLLLTSVVKGGSSNQKGRWCLRRNFAWLISGWPLWVSGSIWSGAAHSAGQDILLKHPVEAGLGTGTGPCHWPMFIRPVRVRSQVWVWLGQDLDWAWVWAWDSLEHSSGRDQWPWAGLKLGSMALSRVGRGPRWDLAGPARAGGAFRDTALRAVTDLSCRNYA